MGQDLANWRVLDLRSFKFPPMRMPSKKQRYSILRLSLSAVVWGCALIGMAAQAQVRLPNIQVPQLPGIQIPLNPGATVNGVVDTLDPRSLRDLRRLRVRELLRTNRRDLEADPNGAPIVRAEIVAYAPNAESLRIASELGFSVVRESTLTGLDIKVVVLRPKARMSVRAALRALRRADPEGGYDFNHIYIESGAVDDTPPPTSPIVAASEARAASVRVGLIDTGIARDHPSLQGAVIEQFGCDSNAAPAAHGTAVASLLIGHAKRFVGAAPSAALYSADVYCNSTTGGSIERIGAAFSWLVERHVPVINVSLVGPPNVLLEKIVTATLARGHLVVAAVGNDGPASPPLYPAAYRGVIGVTGVDAKRRVLLEAVRGPQVYFSAPGADMGAADMQDGYVAVRGTSFSAPIVAGLLAQRLTQPDFSAARRAVEQLTAEAIDLGSRGVDKIYGHGLVGETVRTEANALVAKK